MGNVLFENVTVMKKILKRSMDTFKSTYMKRLVLGGIVSLLTVGVGALLSGEVYAELTADDVEKSYSIATSEFAKVLPVEVQKEKVVADCIGSKEVEKLSEKSQSPIEKSSEAKPTSETKATADKLQGISPEKTDDVVGAMDTRDLETAKVAAETQTSETSMQTKTLQEEQKRYALEALNMQDALALLQSGVIKNLRFYGDFVEITFDESGSREYSKDKGNAISEVLFQLFPSPAGTLSTSYNGCRFSFSKYPISPEIMAKLCAILNDYRNGKIVRDKLLWKEGESLYFEPGFTDEDKKKFLRFYGLNKVIEGNKAAIKEKKDAIQVKEKEQSKCIDKIRELDQRLSMSTTIYRVLYAEKIDEELKKLEAEKKEIQSAIDILSKQSKDLEAFNKNLLPFISTLMDAVDLDSHDVVEKSIDRFNVVIAAQNEELKKNKEVFEEAKKLMQEFLEKKEKGETAVLPQAASKLLTRFKTLESSVKKLTDKKKKLEAITSNVYPKYLTEKILMSYMVKTLNTKADIVDFYSELTKALAQNMSNGIIVANSEDGKKALDAAKKRLENINSVIHVMASEEHSPYKNKPFENGSTYEIYFEKDKVKFKGNFPDCADTTLRHLINLLVYSENHTWNKLFNQVDEEELRLKLNGVIKAINEEGTAPFYDLKTRLQMFFLYQKEKGADDQSKLARSLWAYAICNMNQVRDGMYAIKYVRNGYELETGYINMMKAMWNIASALGLGIMVNGDETTELVKAQVAINALGDTEIYGHIGEKNMALKAVRALETVFSLFHDKNITYDENGFVCNGVSFKIMQNGHHAKVEHTPIQFTWRDDFQKYADEDIFARILLRYVARDKLKNKNVGGFYGALLGEDLAESDEITKTTWYKKMKALSGYNALQGEERNYVRIQNEVTQDVLDGAHLLQVQYLQDMSGQKKKFKESLLNILYSRFLANYNPIVRKDNMSEVWKTVTRFNNCALKQQAYVKVSDSEQKKLKGISYIKLSDTEVKLLIDVDEFKDEVLKIPSKIYDVKGKKELKVVKVGKLGKYDSYFRGTKICFAEGFEDLSIEMFTFSNSENLTEVILPRSLTHLNVGRSVFENCKSLTGFDFSGASLNKICVECNAFKGCTKLTDDINISENTTDVFIGESAFRGTSINNFNLSQATGLKKLYIESYAFQDCSELNINFSKMPSLKSLLIYDDVFKDCKNLTGDFELDENIEYLMIGSNVFKGFTELNVNFSKMINLKNLNIGSNTFDGCKNFTGMFNFGKVRNVKIGNYAFRGTALTDINTSAERFYEFRIGHEAFADCSALKSVSVFGILPCQAYIVSEAFKNCENLEIFDFSKIQTFDGDFVKVFDFNVFEGAFKQGGDLLFPAKREQFVKDFKSMVVYDRPYEDISVDELEHATRLHLPPIKSKVLNTRRQDIAPSSSMSFPTFSRGDALSSSVSVCSLPTFVCPPPVAYTDVVHFVPPAPDPYGDDQPVPPPAVYPQLPVYTGGTSQSNVHFVPPGPGPYDGYLPVRRRDPFAEPSRPAPDPYEVDLSVRRRDPFAEPLLRLTHLEKLRGMYADVSFIPDTVQVLGVDIKKLPDDFRAHIYSTYQVSNLRSLLDRLKADIVLQHKDAIEELTIKPTYQGESLQEHLYISIPHDPFCTETHAIAMNFFNGNILYLQNGLPTVIYDVQNKEIKAIDAENPEIWFKEPNKIFFVTE